MSFDHGKLAADERPNLVINGGDNILLHKRPLGTAGQGIILEIRPQEIFIDDVNGRSAIIEMIEPTSAKTYIQVNLSGEILTFVLPARLEKSIGGEMKISFNTPNVQFIDPLSETNIMVG